MVEAHKYYEHHYISVSKTCRGCQTCDYSSQLKPLYFQILSILFGPYLNRKQRHPFFLDISTLFRDDCPIFLHTAQTASASRYEKVMQILYLQPRKKKLAFISVVEEGVLPTLVFIFYVYNVQRNKRNSNVMCDAKSHIRNFNATHMNIQKTTNKSFIKTARTLPEYPMHM